MYYQHFGLSGPPFQFTPSPHLLYMSKAHREGLAALEWGLKEPSGFTVLVGEAGTGKTTLICSMIAREHAWVRLAYAGNPRLSFEELLTVLVEQLPVTPSRPGKLGLIQALNELLSRLNEQERVAIIIDEAQDLTDATLEELRLLSNFELPERKLLQIILVGQPELLRRLAAPRLRQLNQRVGARAVLEPLTMPEVDEYIDYRLQSNHGSASKIFSPGALRLITRESGGIPRQINMLCHNAMLIAYAAKAKRVETKAMKAALTDCRSALLHRREGGLLAKAAQHLLRLRKGALRLALPFAGIALLGAFGGYLWQQRHVQVEAGLVRPTRLLVPENETQRSPSAASTEPAPEARPRPERKEASQATPIMTPPNVSKSREWESTAAPPITVAEKALMGGAGEPAASGTPRRTTPARVTARQRVVIVRRGDTLATIATRYLGSRDEMGRLLEANPTITNPDLIYPGQTIRLPSASSPTAGG